LVKSDEVLNILPKIPSNATSDSNLPGELSGAFQKATGFLEPSLSFLWRWLMLRLLTQYAVPGKIDMIRPDFQSGTTPERFHDQF
jgi:hypothetical protein